LVFGLYVFIIKTLCWAKRVYELKEKLMPIGKADSAGIRLKGFFAPDVAALINRVRDEYFINPPSSGRKPLVNDKLRRGDRCCMMVMWWMSEGSNRSLR
jgi:hypothetical protein